MPSVPNRRTDPEHVAYRDAWVAEMWAPCPELPRDVRAGLAAVAKVRDERMTA